jgi:glycosyltransferase involved in cell wall biosynthesis
MLRVRETRNIKHLTPNTIHKKLNIIFYAPFKPLGHRLPSGDLVIGTGLYRFLESKGHRLQVASALRSRWIFWKPWRLPHLLVERQRLIRGISRTAFDLWLTYHAYYKGPDLLGPSIASHHQIPYVIFQGAYATKYRRNIRTIPGFILNRHSLQAAQHVFVNKKIDFKNLKRLLPADRISFAAPGIVPEDFSFDTNSRSELRKQWQCDGVPIILTAAMLRPGVKAQGVSWVIRSCEHLLKKGHDFRLIVVGDGEKKKALLRLAQVHIPGKFRFIGRVERSDMYRYYSAADLFVFPGIGESLGMAFLEAQSCRLPVIAFANAGVPEVVEDGITGYLTPFNKVSAFVQAIEKLLEDPGRRQEMGVAAETYVRRKRDLNKNYTCVENKLVEVAAAHR